MNSEFQRTRSRAVSKTRCGDVLEGARPIEAESPAWFPPPKAAGRRPDKDPQFVSGTFTRDGVSLNYKLYLPPGESIAPRPLILMLHGCSQDPDDFAAGTRMNELALRHGWLVLYPEQATGVHPQGCWHWFNGNHQQRGRGEPALLAALTRHVVHTHRANIHHVHVAGLSAGGAMAAVLGRTYPDIFASVGVHSGLPFGVAHQAGEALEVMRNGPATHRVEAGATPPRSVPTIVFHGTRDMTVHPLNGEQLYADAIGDVSSAERVEHGREGGRAYTRKTCTDVDGCSIAELWLIEGAGHAWSGGDQRGSYADWQGPDAASQMICFFSAHPLTSAPEGARVVEVSL